MPGTDGAISVLGTLASVLGGLAVGSCTGTLAGLEFGAVCGFLGSMLDSVLGLALQYSVRNAISPSQHRTLNSLVNLLSATATSWLAQQGLDHNVAPTSAIALLMLVFSLQHGVWSSQLAVIVVLTVLIALFSTGAWQRALDYLIACVGLLHTCIILFKANDGC